MPSHLHKAGTPLGNRSSSRRSWPWRVAVPVACACAGLLATASMYNARGTDLRAGRSTDLIGIVSEQREQVEELGRQSRALQDQVDVLASQVDGSQINSVEQQVNRLSVPAGLRSLVGPGLAVTLDDAPRDQQVPSGIDPNLLVVHQQDIQAVVNALWTGGAEGLSLQGQRIVSTTGIKCVGNTVVLQGVPYSPPYRIVAVGEASALYDALEASPEVQNYRDYVRAPYNLGWSLRPQRRLTVPAYAGPLSLQFATPAESSPDQTPGD